MIEKPTSNPPNCSLKLLHGDSIPGDSPTKLWIEMDADRRETMILFSK